MNERANAVRRPYRLSEWTFVFALPVNPAGFLQAKAYGEFCLLPPPLRSFDEYRSALLDSFQEYIVPLTRLGLRIVTHASAREYCKLLRGTNASILFTHCNGDKLEFREGMVPFKKIVENIDCRFVGIAEICACAPLGLQDMVKAQAPDSLVKISSATLSSRLWMAYYGRFLTEFAAEATFGDACLRTSSLLHEFARGRSNPAPLTIAGRVRQD